MNACAEIREQLLRSWVEDSGPVGTTGEPFPDDATASGHAALGQSGVAAHLESCPHCRKEAQSLERIDRALTRGFSFLDSTLESPSDRIIEETVRRVREVPPELELIRRVRRPVRIILWGVFYAFTLLGCYALAVALLKALKGL